MQRFLEGARGAQLSFTVALAAVSLAACSPARVNQATPHARVTPLFLDFGATPVRFPVQKTFLVQNGGTVPLELSGLLTSGAGAGAFAVSASSFEVAAGDSQQLAVTFAPPTQDSFAASLAFTTNDPAEPSFALPLTGTGALSSKLSARPSALDFGRVGEGQTGLAELDLQSVGPADLYLGKLSFTAQAPPGFGFVGSVKAPATIANGTTLAVHVSFSPLPATLGVAGAVAIDSSDATSPHLEIPLMGSINRAPIAVARGSVGSGAAQAGTLEASVGDTVVVDASSSTDPDGDLPLTYAWSLSQRPSGSAAALGNQTAVKSSLVLDKPGVYAVQLVAFDSTGLASLVPSPLDLRASTAERLVVQLSWDKVPPDLDLHLLEQAATIEGAGDCSWHNPSPTWFGANPDLNPHHHGDALEGYGPELVTWKEPATGRYTLVVVYAQDHHAAAPATTAQVEVYAQGVPVANLTHQMLHQGDSWSAATVEWPSGKVTALPSRGGGSP